MSSKTATKKTTTATKKTEAPAAAAPVVAAPAPVVAAPVVAAPVAAAAPAVEAAAEEVNIVAEFNGMVEKVNALRSALAAVFSDMKKLEKRIPRELKKASKGRRNRKAALAADGTEKPKKESVFTKPSQISDDLCVFLGKAKGTLMSRSEVTTAVCGYAKQKGLMDKQIIKADAALRKLLALSEKDELKILNLQRYLKPHYIKAAPTA
jgi:chromatin remodeling complex protein RSC6